MKHTYLLLIPVLIIAIFSNCAGNKKLQEGSPAEFRQAYYTISQDSTNLYIPVGTIHTDQVTLDSVYFKGLKAPLQEDAQNQGIYFAEFDTRKQDFIMHSDPKEEYINRLPQKSKKTPFELQGDEAVIVYTQNNKTKYFKISGIQERSNE